MRHPACFAILLVAFASCATAADPASAPRERVTRNTTMVTTVDASGQTVLTPITTLAYAGARETAFESSADVVYAAVPAAYQDMGITVGTIDGPNRTAGNRQVRARGRLGRRPISVYLDCGQTALRGPAADAFPVRMSVLSTVVAAGEGSRLRTVVEGSYSSAESSGTVACSSTGELESAIARAVTLRVGTR